jgi:hypothetical protein
MAGPQSVRTLDSPIIAKKLGDAVSKLIPKEEDLILSQGSDAYIKPYTKSKRKMRDIWQSTLNLSAIAC